MKHRHRMPFGATLEADGVQFALWAPSAASVSVVLKGRDPLPMVADSHGWHRLKVPGVVAGARYRYRVVTEQFPDGLDVPDPASRYNPEDTHGPSEVIDPEAFEWDSDWSGRPLHETVVYELHLGTFSRCQPCESATIGCGSRPLSTTDTDAADGAHSANCTPSASSVAPKGMR